MKINEIVQPVVQAEPEPTQQDIQQIQGLLGTIDPAKEEPQGLLTKLSGWIKQYPVLDKVTDMLPQTRLIKAIANAVDNIEAGNGQGALQALAGAVTGGAAANINQVNRAVNTGTALAQGDVQSAALAAGGSVGKVAQAANVGQNLAQNNLQGAAQAVGGTVAKTANLANKAQQYAPQAQAAIQTALAPNTQQPAVSEELTRIKHLSGI